MKICIIYLSLDGKFGPVNSVRRAFFCYRAIPEKILSNKHFNSSDAAASSVFYKYNIEI
jgi:hypothetical protein